MNTSPDKNVESVRQKLFDRSVVGLTKYGVTTERTDIDHHGWLNHLQEELLDAAIYVEAANQSLNLYVLTQDINTNNNTYDMLVVVAKSKKEASVITPSKHMEDWCESKYVRVELIGKAASNLTNGQIICFSYNVV